jgi:hypothetical protein
MNVFGKGYPVLSVDYPGREGLEGKCSDLPVSLTVFIVKGSSQ